MFLIKRPNIEAWLMVGVMPPRLSEFTDNIEKAQVFETEREADYCCKFICDYAFNMIVVPTEMWDQQKCVPMLNKPQPIIQEPLLDYHECRDYLQEKYNYQERNYAKRTFGGDNDDAPYLDFWHWAVDICEVHNGGIIAFHIEMLEEFEKDDFHHIILTHYFDEFLNDGEEEIKFKVEW